MELITTTRDLAQACTDLARHKVITVDTEFMREATYWSQLCLIQMASEERAVLVDPLADGLDLAPFFALMADSSVLKVFHAARQDIEIIYQRAGVIPQPLFDTQIAAMVCGFGEAVSFSNLVKKVVGIDIDKSSQFTNWSRRPLSHKQLAYALADVEHLQPIYRYLERELERSGRADWLAEELALLSAPSTYELRPEEAWQRLKPRVKSKRSLAVMIELAEWRERAAQQQNVPRSRIIKDDAIYDIANQLPQTSEQLGSLRSLHDGFSRSQRGQEVMAAIKRGLTRDPKHLPRLERGLPVPPEAGALIDLLKVLLKAVAAREGVAPKLIATTEELERIAVEAEPAVPALKGWRRELFGEDALRLKRGEIALMVRNGIVVTVRTA
jgi:ribonuclease D